MSKLRASGREPSGTHPVPERSEVAVSGRVAAISTAATLTLIALAMALPAVLDWNVRANHFPPLHAEWLPRVGPGLPFAIVLGVLGIAFGDRLAAALRWRSLLVVVFFAGLAWLLALATVDGLAGIGTILDHPYEYLGTAREVTDFGATLQEYVSRIPFAHPENWPVHIAGHPPGALLFFYVLVKLGLGSALASGFVVTIVGATTPVAVLATVRLLGGEPFARKAAILLVFTPAAIWVAVSGDGMFAAVAAWGMWALARGATARRRGRPGFAMIAWAVLAGLLLGYCVMLSYGLPLLGVLALAVIWLGRDWRVLPITAVAALAVVFAFAAGGFSWWEAFPVLRERYWDGIASRRPPQYWMWGNIAAFAMSAGPFVIASLSGAVAVATRGRHAARGGSAAAARVVAALAIAGWLMVLLADVSQLSRAEVERIWLPFVPWALLGAGFFSRRTRQWALVLQVAFAIVLQCLLQTGW